MSLVSLDLGDNEICGLVTYADEFETDGTYDPSGILALAEALKMPNGSMSTLDLSHNDLGPEGVAALAEALKVPNMSLVSLDLAYNEICGVDTYADGTYDPSGILALAEALKVPNLVTLDLSGKHYIWKLSCIGFSSSEPTFNMHSCRKRPKP